MKAQAKEERTRRAAERSKLLREKQLREAAERDRAEMEQRLLQYQDEMKLANDALVSYLRGVLTYLSIGKKAKDLNDDLSSSQGRSSSSRD